jgi:PAS domain S-box-containing protein
MVALLTNSYTRFLAVSRANAMGSTPNRLSSRLLNLDSPLSTIMLVCLVATLSYVAPRLEAALMLHPQTIWPLWPGCAILVSVLLLVRRRLWPIFIPAAFAGFVLYDLRAGVPVASIAWFIPADTVQVLIAAVSLRYCFDSVPHLNSVKSLAKYWFLAVFLAPFVAAFVSARGIPGNYWTSWRISFVSEVLAFLTLAPAIFSWAAEGREWLRKPRAYHLEAVALMAGTVLLGYITFTSSGASHSPALLYSLVPFLLWSAMRFGSLGISTSMIVIAFLSIWGLVHGRGPFTGQGSNSSMLSLQLFLVFAAAPFMVLAALGEERKQAGDALRKSEERFRLAAQAGKMYAYEWDVATDVVVRSEEHVNVLGFKDQTAPLTRRQLLTQIHPDDRALFLGSVDQLTPWSPTTHTSYRVLRPDGSVVWLEKRVRAFFDEQGKILRVIGMVADISDRKRAEQALSVMSRKLIEAQEQERARIGRELHDDITQRLAMLSVELEQLQNNPSEVRSRVQELRARTTEISDDVQALSHELHASKLGYLGAVGGIRSWCKEFGERQGIQIEFKGPAEKISLPPEIGLCLFRVLQEALHNAAKYSGVGRIEVQLREVSGEIHLIVRDLGRGFDVKAAMQGEGLGLTSMQERVRLVNGIIEIQAKPRGGTTVHVRIPLVSAPVTERATG